MGNDEPNEGTELVAQEEKIQRAGRYLLSEDFRKQLGYAVPRGLDPSRVARIALTEIRRTPKLLDCNWESLVGALMQSAQLGLELGPMGLAWMIPYKQECQLQVGYKGLLNLIWRSELISSVQSEVVYEGDQFEYANGIPPRLTHIPQDHRAEEALPTHVYAIIGTTAGGWIFRVMTADDVEKHRQRFSKAKQSPWVTDWDEMACKTLLKRTGKRAPVSVEAQKAIVLDDEAERGLKQSLPAMEVQLEPEESKPAEEPKPMFCGHRDKDATWVCALPEAHDGDHAPE